MTNRYLDAVRGVLAGRYRDSPGIGVLVAPATEQALVARAVAALWDAAVTELPAEVSALDALPPLVVVTLPADLAQARAALEVFNGARSRVTAPGRLVIVVVDRGQLLELQRLAGDAYSVAAITAVCPFVPDDGVDEMAARQALAAWQRQRFGRLDLRGFIRAHTEDVAWSVEALYQDLRAIRWLDDLLWRKVPGRDGGEPLPVHLGRIFEEASEPDQDGGPARAPRAILLGHPGAGKTFFLRWLALHAAEVDALFGMFRPLPVLVPLSAFARAPRPLRLDEYIVENLLQQGQPAAHVLDSAAQSGRVLFLLDGLDEAGDELVRRIVAQAVRDLAERFPACPIVATSRLSGYTEAPIEGQHLVVSPLDDGAIERFLVTWSELYARDLHGPAAAERGRQEGRNLARDVLANPAIAELARNPLMLTVLAIVHRAGVRLPDHRVELYSHATQILVERWNQVRSLAEVGGSVPIKAADAVRLLGPVALAVVRSGTRGAVSEEVLRAHLAHAIEAGHLRALTSADEALELFQRSLGILVEQAPGMYAFLHLTLAEYSAAWELVRSDELEKMAANPREAFLPRWREVLLLAAGVLGILRADDHRLEVLVGQLIDAAGRRKGKPSPSVPSLLAGLLADDPGLSQHTTEAVLDFLIPTWWFERKYGVDSIDGVFREAFEINRRMSRRRFKQLVRERLRRHYGAGLSPAMEENLTREQSPQLDWLTELRIVLVAADVDESGIFFQLCTRPDTGRWLPWPLATLPGSDPTRLAFLIGRSMARAVQRGALRLDIRANRAAIPCLPDWDQARAIDDKEAYFDVPFGAEDDGRPVPPAEISWLYIHAIEILGPLAPEAGT